MLYGRIENWLSPVKLSFFFLSTLFVKDTGHMLRKRWSGGIVRFSDSSSSKMIPVWLFYSGGNDSGCLGPLVKCFGKSQSGKAKYRKFKRIWQDSWWQNWSCKLNFGQCSCRYLDIWICSVAVPESCAVWESTLCLNHRRIALLDILPFWRNICLINMSRFRRISRLF